MRCESIISEKKKLLNDVINRVEKLENASLSNHVFKVLNSKI